MQDLIKKVGRFIEGHIEKIVLVVVGLACVVVFFKWVILSPTAVKLDRKTLSAGRIDKEILERAKELERSLNSTSDNRKAPPYRSVLTGPIDANNPVIAGLFDRALPQGFMGLFRSPLSYITQGAPIMPPGRTLASSFRRFKLPPRIGNVAEVAANHIRAAAWIPLEELTPEKGYDKVGIDVNDVDLVTVEAKFDTVQLYRQFRAHFAGEEVARADWRDPCLAEPVFAAVQLQRRELLSNGAWEEWKEVPRSQVEPYRELFKVIERVEDLPPGGLEIRMMQFKPEMVRMDLLQPQAYEIASAEEEWFPPSFYGKYKILQKKVEMEEKRDERQKDRNTTQTRDDGRYRSNTPGGGQAAGAGGRYRPGTGGAGGDSMYGGRRRGGTSQQDNMYGPGYAGDPSARRRGASKGRTRGMPDEAGLYGDMMYGPGMEMTAKASLNQVYLEFGDTLIKYQMKLDELEEPLLFWAFDDTVQPGSTYEYRIRLGVFNPVAGTNQIAEQDLSKKDQVILWSEFSDVTKPVEIQDRMYFFAKDVQEAKKSATVEIARYTLGYWRSEDFEVKPGEAIGKGMKPKVEEKKRLPGMVGGRITDPMYAAYNTPYGQGGIPGPGAAPGAGADKAAMPDWVDYRTGKVLLDLVQVSDWGEAPNLRPRMYHEMLYTGDGHAIEHMPVSTTNWPKDLVAAYQYVKTEMRREPQPFRAFKKGGMRSRIQPMMGGYEGMGGMYDEMMFMQPPGGGAYR
ncbi:MAG: hypothetical protein JW955_16370 [Sedimentisphaerales bacterium]|nr:hypothetical protein [Sedimentisphaerales bacterium]